MLCCVALVPLLAVGAALLAFKTFSHKEPTGDPDARGSRTAQGATAAAAGLSGATAAAQRRDRARSAAQRGDIRLGNDGFWFNSPHAQAGWLIRFAYMIDNRPHSTEVTYEPAPRGHFVYTGGTPTDVEIVEIRPADPRPSGMGPILTSDRPFFDDIDPAPPRSPPKPVDPRPFTGYPSAY